MEISGKSALVTGGGGAGSGRAIARRLAREGAAVMVGDVDEGGARETVRRIQAEGGRATFLRCDVSVEPEVVRLVGATVELGRLGIVVNDASAPVPEGSLERWFETVAVDLLGTMCVTYHAIEAMRSGGGGDRHHRLHIGSRPWKQALSLARLRRREGRCDPARNEPPRAG
jgi:NAD(P)-dependent dehydrogenase (short-subunit alcohol dehydrogenase family)